MGEFSLLLQEISKDKEKFYLLVEKMNPLIKKYTRLLYKDESEDVRSEFLLALWEALLKMEFYDNDGKCMTFLCNALRNRFFELYRASKKQHDTQGTLDEDMLSQLSAEENSFYDFIVREDIKNILAEESEMKQNICYAILFEELPDAEIAKRYGISRQYVHRVKKHLYLKLKDWYF